MTSILKAAEHNGDTIELRSYHTEGRWRADARFRAEPGGAVFPETFELPSMLTFADEAEADFSSCRSLLTAALSFARLEPRPGSDGARYPGALARLLARDRRDRRGDGAPGLRPPDHALLGRRAVACDVLRGHVRALDGGSSAWEVTPWRAVQRAAWGARAGTEAAGVLFAGPGR